MLSSFIIEKSKKTKIVVNPELYNGMTGQTSIHSTSTVSIAISNVPSKDEAEWKWHNSVEKDGRR